MKTMKKRESEGTMIITSEECSTGRRRTLRRVMVVGGCQNGGVSSSSIAGLFIGFIKFELELLFLGLKWMRRHFIGVGYGHCQSYFAAI